MILKTFNQGISFKGYCFFADYCDSINALLCKLKGDAAMAVPATHTIGGGSANEIIIFMI